MNSAFTWYIAWAAIPLILSVALFWLTDSKAFVTTSNQKKEQAGSNSDETLFSRILASPFGNIGVKITGAAALFFIIFIMMNPIKTGFYDKQVDWKLKIDFKDAQTGKTIPTGKFVKVEVVPELIQSQMIDNKFLYVSLSGLREENNKLVIPYSIRFLFENYEMESIPLQDSINYSVFCQRDKATKYITVKTRFLTKRDPDALPVALTNDTSVLVSEKILTSKQ